MTIKTLTKLIGSGVALILIIVTVFLTFGINDAGQRTVIQYPNGTIKVKFTPGGYLSWFGKTTEYNDVITFDFDKNTNDEGATLDQQGISVRYQDGGTGTMYGIGRFALPNDEESMVKLHKEFRSHRGVAFKLIKAITEESNNLTAGLMTSEEAYAEKRGTSTDWSKQQLVSGKFKTKLEQRFTEDIETGKKVLKSIPVIDYGEDGLPKHHPSDLASYGITVTSYNVTDWDFEPKTLAQIAAKREATMAIITAKAQAEEAKQDAITAEAKGKAAVVKAQYEKEVEKEKAVVEAEQRKAVATIEAEQKVEVAAQAKLEATEKKLAAAEYKEEQILIGEGEAERKRLVLEADGALEQKLEAWTLVNSYYADAVAKQKWVPEIQFGTSGDGGDTNAANDLLQLLLANTAKDISLDMTIDSPKGQ